MGRSIVQNEPIEIADVYLRKWAAKLHISDLLERALKESC